MVVIDRLQKELLTSKFKTKVYKLANYSGDELIRCPRN